MLSELDLKLPKSEYKVLEDPYLLGGYGVNALFGILSSLAWMLIFMFIFAIPIFYIYQSGHRYDGYRSQIVS